MIYPINQANRTIPKQNIDTIKMTIEQKYNIFYLFQQNVIIKFDSNEIPQRPNRKGLQQPDADFNKCERGSM